MSAKFKPFKATLPMGQAAGAGRTYPTLSSVTVASETVTRNDDGQVSSPGMTARYVESFLYKNHLKR